MVHHDILYMYIDMYLVLVAPTPNGPSRGPVEHVPQLALYRDPLAVETTPLLLVFSHQSLSSNPPS